MSSSHLPFANRLKFMLLFLQLLTKRNLSMHLTFFLHWNQTCKMFWKEDQYGKAASSFECVVVHLLKKKSDLFCVKSRSLLIFCASFILVSFIFQPGNTGWSSYICVYMCRGYPCGISPAVTEIMV